MTSRTVAAVRSGILYPYPLSVLQDDPVGYWRLGEAAGTTATDATPYAHNGTDSGTGITYGYAGTLPHDPSTAYLFDGAAGLVTLPMLLAGLTSSMTVEFRVNLPSASIHGVAIKIGTASDFTGWSVGFGTNNMDTNGATLIGGIDGVAWVLPGGSALSTGVNHLVDVVIDSTHKFNFYVDGSTYGSVTGDQISHTSHGNCYIGGQGDGTRKLNAIISDVVFFNYGLTSTQIGNRAIAGS